MSDTPLSQLPAEGASSGDDLHGTVLRYGKPGFANPDFVASGLAPSGVTA